MNLENLTFTGKAKMDVVLHKIIEVLPEGIIEELHNYNVRGIEPIEEANGIKGIKIMRMAISQDSLTVNFSADCKNAHADTEGVSFEYMGNKYLIYF